jgi:hypothetical protein
MVELCEKNTIGWCMWTTKKVGDGGATQPYSIKKPANYSSLVNAVEGGSISQSAATTIMFELADNAATAKCVKNRAFISALGLNPDAATGSVRKEKPGKVEGSTIRPFFDATGLKVVLNLPTRSDITLSLYDSRGMLRKSFFQAGKEAGMHVVRLENRDGIPALSDGIYYCILSLNGKKSYGISVLLVNGR